MKQKKLFTDRMKAVHTKNLNEQSGRQIPIGDWITLTVSEDGFELKNESGALFHLTDEEFKLLQKVNPLSF